MDRQSNFITRLISELGDGEELGHAFEQAVLQREAEDREREGNRRKEIQNNIRVYLLDGNHIRLRRTEQMWVAQHFNLNVSAAAKSLEDALQAVFDATVAYTTELWKRDVTSLSTQERDRRQFIISYGSVDSWQQRFQSAILQKIQELTPVALHHDSIGVASEADLIQLKETVESLQSVFKQFKQSLILNPPVLQAKNFDVENLRVFYNRNLISLQLTKVHVTIMPDNDQLILHFMEHADLNGLDVTIFRMDRPTPVVRTSPLITRTIQGNDIRFALSELGLTIRELDQVGFRIKLGNRHVCGRL